MVVLTIIIVVLALILLLPVGADACIQNSGGYVKAKLGPIKIDLVSFPRKDRPRKAKYEEEADKAQDERKERKRALKLEHGDILPVIKMGLRALGRFRRRLSVDLLEIEVVCGGNDPYNTAMSYGYISAAFGTLIPLAERVFKIADRKIKLDIDFDSGCFRYFARLIMTVQVWEILYIAFAFLFEFISYKIKKRKEIVRQERNDSFGQPDQRSYERDDEQSQEHGGRKHDRRRTDNIA